MSAIFERARAKINLTLRVLGRRADGYHLLESLIVFAGVGDGVTFEPGVPAAVEMTGPYASAIAGSNLVDTALAALAAADPILTLGRVSVDKQLPIAAGIGGGSSDTAAVLRAVRRINPANGVDWDRLAAGLGADVSVCLADRSSLVWGVGEHVEPVEGLPRLDAVLVCPQSAAPFGKTKSVFGRLAVGEAATASPPLPLPAFSSALALVDYMRGVGNDLRTPAHAVLPDSAEAEAGLNAEAECLHVSLSGAGPTSFGLFPDARSAAAAADRLRARHPHWWIVATTLGD
jgi:4-diphosphocytidyl-2-C-methyl-D-erythritol kinase